MLPLSLALFLCVASAGCFGFGVQAKHARVSELHGATLHACLWNVVDPDPLVVAERCGDAGLSLVRARTNYAYLLAGVLTLGAWLRMDMEWRCAGDGGTR